MAKFYGMIGYGKTEEVSDGVWEKKIIERPYYGDLLRNSISFQSSGNLNDNVNLSNEISIVSDIFATMNFQFMLYIVLRGAKWKITNVEVKHPRLILTVGGVYVA